MAHRALFIFSAALLLAAPSLAGAVTGAAVEEGAWTSTGDSIRAAAAGITLPQTIATLSLSKSGEASNGGRAVDNYAQYLSSDGVVQATFYVYMPTYADASLAADMTDKAIMARFGAKTRRTAYDSVAVAGHPGTAIRAVYDAAADGALTTVAGFVHVGHWIVKMRVTGPTQRRAEVIAGLDGMLTHLTLDHPDALHATAPVRFDACPAAATQDARLTKADNADDALPRELGIPRDGKDQLCVRGTVTTASGSYDMLQQAHRSDGPIIVPVDDSGTILAFDPAKGTAGYKLSIHMVGQTDLYGTYDAIPSPRQIAAILDGNDPQTAQAKATAAYAANGQVTMIRTARAR